MRYEYRIMGAIGGYKATVAGRARTLATAQTIARNHRARIKYNPYGRVVYWIERRQMLPWKRL